MRENVYEGKVYNFTNENLEEYRKIYNFNNSKILSVIGSGDQYFTSILNGSNNIELYDINICSWYYFILKYYAILTFSYEEFYNFFVVSNCNNKELYDRVSYFLPNEIKLFFDNYIKKNKKLSLIFLKNTIYELHKDRLDKIIPYFNKDKYYELKYLLTNINLPKVYFSNIIDLPKLLNDNNYDLMFTSNIYSYLGFDYKKYINLLNRFNVDTIQAHYSWLFKPKDSFIQYYFDIKEIDSIFKNRKDYVLTLKKNKYNMGDL